MFPPIEDTTPSGYDLQFGTNVVGEQLSLRRDYMLNPLQAISISQDC